ncbi:MAG TPA: hypothetical protein VMB34_25635 [Acetobacteraceae bacterium]|nr:hypothetical protein [Acetobacteraceae bacterium]
MRTPRKAGRAELVVLVLLVSMVAAFAQTDHSFMPKGGNVLLPQMFAKAPDADVHAVVSAKHTAAEWQDVLRPRSEGLSDQEQRTLAAYLATNMPLPTDTAAHANAASLSTILPPDGDELAWNHCGSCHSLFTGYLGQSRDVTGWHNIFLSPFHRGIKMTEQERDTFAGYAAINMPLPREKVPEDLRF